MIDISIWGLLAAMGVPTAVTGLLFWWLKRRIEAGAKTQAERQAAQETLMVLMIQAVQATMAHAIQRGHPNGDMEAALTYSTSIKHKIKDHLTTIGVHSLIDD